ncbi:hypothetical protein AMR72_04895 [Flavobacterium psychrophilum]|nr:hypothetical protein AMR72_04895 [Flavobacterium psychrophilum]AOE51912.1 hypothetical protein ALW18_04890 [Flavobacterium psychrophilum]
MKSFYFLIALITFSANAQQNEAIDWNEARINGKLELTISKRDFEAIYKKADSIVTPNYEDICGSDEDSRFQYYHYKGLQYELDNGIMNFRQITFGKKNPMFFTYKGQRLDGSTKMDDFAKLFPESAKTGEKDQKEIYIVLASSDIMDDSSWRFTFRNGVLAAIECFFPC